MRRFYVSFFLVFTLALGYFVYWQYFEPANLYNQPSPTPFAGPTPKGDNYKDIEFTGNMYRVGWIKIENISSLSLFSNLPDSETAEKRMAQKQCKYLVNGGFYSKESRPIGVFISGGEQINQGQKNTLFNGVFSVSDKDIPSITSDIHATNLRFALQSGPILIADGQLQQINLKADPGERRMVVTLDKNNKVTFLSIYNSSSVYLGPHLADVPDILREFEKKTGEKFMFALNLDGGTASAFYSDSLSLPELSPIGSYFCVK